MARDRAAPPPSGGAELAVCERFGPLAIERVAKSDGRALILYAHAGVRASLEHEQRDDRRRPDERERR